MRVAVMGAGAVGAYFGARLAGSGLEVAFIARGKHLEAMRSAGLHIKSISGDQHIRSMVTSKPAEVGIVDLILFSVKTYDAEEAAGQLQPFIGRDTLILCLQNGVDGAEKLARLWGRQRTRAGVVYIAAQVESPGVIQHTAGGKIVFGELEGTVGAGTRRIYETLSQAQIPCEISTDIAKVMWQKLVWNAPFCAICCLLRAPVKAILESDSLTKLAADCMEEVREAAACQGIHLDRSIIAQTFHFSQGLGDFRPSMLQDLDRGKPLEYEALNGMVCDLLHRYGKQAPVNEAFYATLKFLDERNRRREHNPLSSS